jgi:hypothetical protein
MEQSAIKAKAGLCSPERLFAGIVALADEQAAHYTPSLGLALRLLLHVVGTPFPSLGPAPSETDSKGSIVIEKSIQYKVSFVNLRGRTINWRNLPRLGKS